MLAATVDGGDSHLRKDDDVGLGWRLGRSLVVFEEASELAQIHGFSAGFRMHGMGMGLDASVKFIVNLAY